MGALVTLMNLTKERAAQGIKDEAGREPSPVKSSDMFVVGGQNQLKLFGRPALGEVLTFAPALDQCEYSTHSSRRPTPTRQPQ